MKGEFEFSCSPQITKSCVAQTPRAPHFCKTG